MPRKLKRRKHKNKTAHKQAIADPEVRDDIVRLRREWDRIDPIERGTRLCQLAGLGCSTRGLELRLKKSATNIRRHMTLAALPKQKREAIKAGSSAKEILASKAYTDRMRKREQRIALDRSTGEISDRVADTIVAFCKTVEGVPQNPIAKELLVTFLSEVQNAAWQMQSVGLRPPTLPKLLTVKHRFLLARPPYAEDIALIANMARWLAILVLADAPERDIWERAIDKARKRAPELRVKLTLEEHFQVARERKRKIEMGPPRRPW